MSDIDLDDVPNLGAIPPAATPPPDENLALVPYTGTSPLDSMTSIPDMADFVLSSGDLSNVNRAVDKLATPQEKQLFFQHMAKLFDRWMQANDELSVYIWNAAERVRPEMESIGAWDATLEIHSTVKKHQQAYHRKQNSRRRLLRVWPENWRDLIPNVTFPSDGSESEKFLQELSTVATLQTDPTQVSELLEKAVEDRVTKRRTKKDPMVKLAEIQSVKEILQSAVSIFECYINSNSFTILIKLAGTGKSTHYQTTGRRYGNGFK